MVRLALAALLALSVAAPAAAQSPVSFDAGIAIYSNYTWRGYQVTDAVSAQPSATLSWPDNGFSFNVWGAAAMQDRDTYENFDEIDFTAAWSRELGTVTPIQFEAGYIYYAFPRLDGDNKTQELFAGLSWDTPLSPAVTAYYDFDLVDAFYVSPSVSHGIPFGAAGLFSLDLGLALGFTDALADADGDEGFGLQDMTISVSSGIPVGPNASVTPMLAFTRADESIFADETQFWGGASLDYSW